MKRAATIGLWLMVGGPLACSGGDNPAYLYGGGGPQAYDDGAESDGGDSEGGIDLDGGGPKPPPPGDGPGLPPPEHHGDCCEGNGTPGCDNVPVEQCVCATDAWCCESEWDDACAALIEQLGCGHCTAGDGGDPPPPPVGGGDCCSEHGTPGCDDPAVEACVCDIEPYCCDNQWSAACTAVLEVHGCGQCDGGGQPPPPGGDDGGPPPPPGGDDGGQPPPGGDGDCCASNGTPGCDDPGVQSCVCMQDAYCCDNEWDGLCASEVETFGCGSCGGGGGSGGGGDTGGDTGGGVSACCQQQSGAGCPETDVESCVCAEDDYCCNVFWDLTCAGEVELFGCGSCS